MGGGVVGVDVGVLPMMVMRLSMMRPRGPTVVVRSTGPVGAMMVCPLFWMCASSAAAMCARMGGALDGVSMARRSFSLKCAAMALLRRRWRSALVGSLVKRWRMASAVRSPCSRRWMLAQVAARPAGALVLSAVSVPAASAAARCWTRVWAGSGVLMGVPLTMLQ